MRKNKSKLAITAQTVKNLTAIELADVAGGSPNLSRDGLGNSCDTCSCPPIIRG